MLDKILTKVNKGPQLITNYETFDFMKKITKFLTLAEVHFS